MSLESYKKCLDAQHERDKDYSQPQQQDVVTKHVYVKPLKSRKRGLGRLIASLIIIAFFVVAAIKNPSSIETKSLIKNSIVEKINERMGAVIMNDDNNSLKQFGAIVGMSLVPHLLDYYTNIDVSDYVIFSTFDCTAKKGEETKTIVSGIVVFGKVIPLKSDLKQDSLEFE